MKKVITIMVMVLMMLSATACTAHADSNGFSYKQVKSKKGYVTKFYSNDVLVGKIKTKKRIRVCVVDSEDVYPQFVWERKNNFILVEVIKGKCLNDEGDGETSDGYYISYKRVKGHEAGARYETYCIYANNNGEDDIRYRVDYRK